MVRNHKLQILIRAFLLVVLLLPSCAKGDMSMEAYPDYPYRDDPSQDTMLSIGTLRSRDGVQYIQLDAVSAGFIVNPDEVRGISDGTRVFVQFRCVVSPSVPDFCSDAILVEWASPLDVGDIRYDLPTSQGDPVSLVLDWITSLEDGFLTLHYTVMASGNVGHTFSLCPTDSPYGYRLLHEAHGDQGGSLTDGIVCFPVEALLPKDTGEGSVTLSLTYLNMEHIQKTLTIEYRSPK